MKIVSYLRVSTAKQGHSGLGLEAQRAAIAAYISQRGGTLTREFIELESGKIDTRPQLAAALRLSKGTGATLVIAKLDRLSRNVTFLCHLQDSGVKFVAADMPDANEITVQIMAVVAQQERKAISTRTREALAAAKARGTVLGNPNGAAALRRAGKGNAASITAIQANASKHAETLRPVLGELAAKGVTSLGEIAAHLTEEGWETPRGNTYWHKASVRNLLARLQLGG